jgi:hypothetical protein
VAYGQKQLFIAIPQPGTSNLPYPVTVRKGGLAGLLGGTTTYPPFVPVVCSVNDLYGVSVTASTAATVASIEATILQLIGTSIIPGTLGAIDNKLELIAKQLVDLADILENLSKSMNQYKINMNSMISINTEKNILQSTKVSDQINNNYFYKIADGETPELPSFKESLKENLKKIKDFNVLVETESLIKSATNKLTSLVKEQIGSFDTTFGISDWIKQKIETLKVAILPSTRKTVAAIEAKTKVTWT